MVKSWFYIKAWYLKNNETIVCNWHNMFADLQEIIVNKQCKSQKPVIKKWLEKFNSL